MEMYVQMVGNASLGNPSLKISTNQGVTLVNLSTKQSRTENFSVAELLVKSSLCQTLTSVRHVIFNISNVL